MDREFIEKNQIVERYITGRLPIKGKQDFERFCREHPDVLDELKLAEYLNEGMRLLEASGKPLEPEVQQKPPLWRRWEFTLGLGAATLLLAILASVIAAQSSSRGRQIEALEEQIAAGPLIPPAKTRSMRIVPERNGPTSRPSITLRLKEEAELIELRVDVSYAKQNAFRLTFEKKDQARAGAIHNLLRDSNGELRLTVNSSALTPGLYQFSIEGVTMRGSLVPVGWAAVRVVE